MPRRSRSAIWSGIERAGLVNFMPPPVNRFMPARDRSELIGQRPVTAGFQHGVAIVLCGQPALVACNAKLAAGSPRASASTWKCSMPRLALTIAHGTGSNRRHQPRQRYFQHCHVGLVLFDRLGEVVQHGHTGRVVERVWRSPSARVWSSARVPGNLMDFHHAGAKRFQFGSRSKCIGSKSTTAISSSVTR